MSTRRPSGSSCSISTNCNSMSTASLSWSRLSASHGVKSFSSWDQIERRGIGSRLPSSWVICATPSPRVRSVRPSDGVGNVKVLYSVGDILLCLPLGGHTSGANGVIPVDVFGSGFLRRATVADLSPATGAPRFSPETAPGRGLGPLGHYEPCFCYREFHGRLRATSAVSMSDL